MRPGQRELRIVMIKCRRTPGRGCVALSTDMIEIILHMVGIGDILVIGGMASIAFTRRIIEPRGVASRTWL